MSSPVVVDLAPLPTLEPFALSMTAARRMGASGAATGFGFMSGLPGLGPGFGGFGRGLSSSSELPKLPDLNRATGSLPNNVLQPLSAPARIDRTDRQVLHPIAVPSALLNAINVPAVSVQSLTPVEAQKKQEETSPATTQEVPMTPPAPVSSSAAAQANAQATSAASGAAPQYGHHASVFLASSPAVSRLMFDVLAYAPSAKEIAGLVSMVNGVSSPARSPGVWAPAGSIPASSPVYGPWESTATGYGKILVVSSNSFETKELGSVTGNIEISGEAGARSAISGDLVSARSIVVGQATLGGTIKAEGLATVKLTPPNVSTLYGVGGLDARINGSTPTSVENTPQLRKLAVGEVLYSASHKDLNRVGETGARGLSSLVTRDSEKYNRNTTETTGLETGRLIYAAEAQIQAERSLSDLKNAYTLSEEILHSPIEGLFVPTAFENSPNSTEIVTLSSPTTTTLSLKSALEETFNGLVHTVGPAQIVFSVDVFAHEGLKEGVRRPSMVSGTRGLLSVRLWNIILRP
jgi:hypothetical protein